MYNICVHVMCVACGVWHVSFVVYAKYRMLDVRCACMRASGHLCDIWSPICWNEAHLQIFNLYTGYRSLRHGKHVTYHVSQCHQPYDVRICEPYQCGNCYTSTLFLSHNHGWGWLDYYSHRNALWNVNLLKKNYIISRRDRRIKYAHKIYMTPHWGNCSSNRTARRIHFMQMNSLEADEVLAVPFLFYISILYLRFLHYDIAVPQNAANLLRQFSLVRSIDLYMCACKPFTLLFTACILTQKNWGKWQNTFPDYIITRLTIQILLHSVCLLNCFVLNFNESLISIKLKNSMFVGCILLCACGTWILYWIHIIPFVFDGAHSCDEEIWIQQMQEVRRNRWRQYNIICLIISYSFIFQIFHNNQHVGDVCISVPVHNGCVNALNASQ